MDLTTILNVLTGLYWYTLMIVRRRPTGGHQRSDRGRPEPLGLDKIRRLNAESRERTRHLSQKRAKVVRVGNHGCYDIKVEYEDDI